MKEINLQGSQVLIDRSEVFPMEVFASNLTLHIRTAFVEHHTANSADTDLDDSHPEAAGPSSSRPPEIFITFRQYELSTVQTSGVYLIIIGVGILLTGLAVAWGNSLMSRVKIHNM
jgi:hypothetical protein